MRHFLASLSLVAISSAFVACSSGGGPKSEITDSASAGEQLAELGLIKVNQVGYLPDGQKFAAVPASAARQFFLINENGEEVYKGKLEKTAGWAPAQERVALADFGDYEQPGRYRVKVEGFPLSPAFVIAEDVYSDAHDAAIKAYYFNRASTALTDAFAGEWARPKGHPDDRVKIHWSAASAMRPEGTVLASPKGWYDAGDYNKYIVNSGISTYTLLAAYEHFSRFYDDRTWNIPESGDKLPDLLNEILWNLDWMETMQDPADGGVYHKLTTLGFSGDVMPADATEQRYMVAKGTAATLDFAAVMATASRVFVKWDAAQAIRYREAAVAAWRWAEANPQVVFTNPKDVHTGEYGDTDFADERAWAAAELFITTGDQVYYRAFKAAGAGAGVPSWGYVAPLAHVSLAFHSKDSLSSKEYETSLDALVETADELEDRYRDSAYRVSMTTEDFVWGSNSGAANQAFILLQAYRLTGEDKYRAAALGIVDYLLGKNPMDYSYVTGLGSKPPEHIHHRQSEADNVTAPVPGFLAGGPNAGQQDNCDYRSQAPAKSYVDSWCSYASNEIAINWNAPLVYVLAGLMAD